MFASQLKRNKGLEYFALLGFLLSFQVDSGFLAKTFARDGTYRVVLGLGTLLIALYYCPYLVHWPFASVDLPGHIAVIERLYQHLALGRLFFFDFEWFGGWPAFVFYGFFSQLLVAVFSLPVGLLIEEPVGVVMPGFICFGLALLPLSVFRLFLEVSKSLSNARQVSRLSVAVWSLAASAWFLGQEFQWFGVGAVSILHVGLLSQLLAWHLLILTLAELPKLLERGVWTRLGVLNALLLLAHPLSFVFSAFSQVVFFVVYRRAFLKLSLSAFLALALSAFWLMPFLAFSRGFTGYDLHQPTGELLQMIFPFEAWSLGKMSMWNTLIGISLSLSLGLSLLQRKLSQVAFLAVLVVLANFFFGSDVLASNLPLPIHYYRLEGLAFLVAILASCSFFLSYRLIPLGLIVFFSLFFLPHPERHQVLEGARNDFDKPTTELLTYLGNRGDVGGRVGFEYLDNYKEAPFLAAHLPSSRLSKKAGLETWSGLFIQSSLSARYPAVLLNKLGVKTWSMPDLFEGVAGISRTEVLKRLRDFNIQFLVLGEDKLGRKLGFKTCADLDTPEGRCRLTQVGAYHVLELASPRAFIRPIEKRVLSFFSSQDDSDFKIFNYWFFSEPKLWENFHLLEVGSLEEAVMFSDIILDNSASCEPENREGHICLHLRERHSFLLGREKNPEFSALNQISKQLEELRLREKLLESLASDSFASNRELSVGKIQPPSASIDKLAQTIDLSNMNPGSLYELDFSFFPYWEASSGSLYRGGGERVYFYSGGLDREQAQTGESLKVNSQLSYSYWNSGVSKLGALVSLSALALLFAIVIRDRNESLATTLETRLPLN